MRLFFVAVEIQPRHFPHSRGTAVGIVFALSGTSGCVRIVTPCPAGHGGIGIVRDNLRRAQAFPFPALFFSRR